MVFDKFGINEVKGIEGTYTHKNYPNNVFNKSSFLKEWVDGFINSDIKTIFDIGAFEGGDSLRFASWYPNAMIYTIEASPDNFQKLNKKIGCVSNIKTFNYIMSYKNGIIPFYQTTAYSSFDGDMIMGSIYDIKEEKKAQHGLKNIETINIESISYDSFCEKNNIVEVDIAHIDIEGAGYSLSLGMTKALPKLIFMEQEGNEFFKNKKEGGNDKLVELLKSKGYSVALKLPNDYLFVRNN